MHTFPFSLFVKDMRYSGKYASVLIRRTLCRQRHRKAAALSRLALYTNGAAAKLCDSFADGKPQAKSLPCAGSISLEIWFKKMLPPSGVYFTALFSLDSRIVFVAS